MSDEGPTQIFAGNFARNTVSPVIDIIFVHGLGGDRHDTWQYDENSFWPKWLAEDFPACRVYMAGYDSAKFAGALSGDGTSIQDIASILADGIASRESSAPYLLLITHSLGGLVVKQMLRRCKDTADRVLNDVGRAVCGVTFLGTPHQGAGLSTTLDFLLRRFKSKQSKQLAFGDDNLIDLNEFFRSLVGSGDMVVRSFYETENTWGVRIVDKVSANPGIYGSDPVAVQGNHLEICKPKNRDSQVYQSICATIRRLLKDKSGPSQGGKDRISAGDEAAAGPGHCTQAEALPPDILSDYQFYTTTAEEDRRDLAEKLIVSGRGYLIKDARRKKEQFNMALHRHIAQPAAVTRYTKLMADIETRFNRHVARVIAEGGSAVTVDEEIQKTVIEPCVRDHSTRENEITVRLIDSALYYLAGNCHIAWDNG